MAYKIEIINYNVLQVTDVTEGVVAVYQPKKNTWYEEDSLRAGLIKFYGDSAIGDKNTNKYEYNKVGRSFKGFPLSECIDYADNPFTLEEIGDAMGLTRERVRQIREKALQKLREPSKNRRLKEFCAHKILKNNRKKASFNEAFFFDLRAYFYPY